MKAVGIDLGGSAVKAGAVTELGEVLARRSIPVDPRDGASHLLDRIAELARELGVERAIGLGSPGLLDRALGSVIEAPNLHFIEGLSLRDELAKRLSLPIEAVLLENDANVAALAEQWLGAGRGETDLLTVTLGTGVGGGLILAGKPYAGPAGMAGEIGHVVVDPLGPRCGCGSRGCLETFASASAARRRAIERGLPRDEPGDLELLTQAARRGPGPERELLVDIGMDLGRGLAAVLTLLDLRVFVVGGGFSAALDVLEPGIRAGLAERTYGTRIAGVRIVPASLGADAGWIGAARLALSFQAR